ncbi:ankyrin repeat domain-containing protein [Wolbachia endosymbiont of Drosophila pseudotakahashii]|uniref:ankyrin repeat domain-containing protein n=1 Tax=Wolbachia endosymbiont of Drosophila pseudotakahashii TaxID=375919 RepID=UPI00225315FD|nr:ankyrin repeat domain-containing protein [Wolbachia endosymbiont of Drosophila pseudotakahashii]MCX3064433.1 ankyrin repeat domain-containing protein [Wolbachia endosymbiont of Drosophila pseudotakahashii]
MKDQTSLTTDFTHAIENDDFKRLEEYIDQHIDKYNVNRELLDKLPLLSWAACKNSVNVAQLLLSIGADIDIRCDQNWTPLHYAVSAGQYDMVRFLVDQGASIVAKDNNVKTPLRIVNELGNTEVANFLRAKLDKYLFSAIERKDIRKVSDFLDGGANIEAKGINNQTPLCVASCKGNLYVLKLLLSRNAKVNVQDDSRKTPLHYAAREGHSDVAELLLGRGTMIDAEDCFSMAPLHYAAYHNRKNMVSFLIKQDAKIEAVDKEAKTPLHYAAGKGHLDVAELLLDRGAIIDAEDRFGMAPLHYAACYNREDVVSFLISRDAKVEAMDEEDKTPLHYAAGEGHLDAAKLLLDHDSIINAKDRLGIAPLHYAAYYNREGMVSFLISQGAKVEAMDEKARTPLHYAAREGHLGVAKLLLECDAIIDAKDCYDRDPLYYADSYNKLDVVRLLEGRNGVNTCNPLTNFLSACIHSPIARYFGSACIEGAPILYRRQRASAIDHNALEGSLRLFSICKGGREGIDKTRFNKEISYLHENAYLYDVLLLQDEENQNTLLHVVIKENQVDLVKELLCILKEPYRSNKVYECKYFEGKQENEKPLSKVINSKDKDGKDAITLAIEGNDPECISALFKYLIYENINRRKDVKSDYTPLHEAVRSRSSNAISALLKSEHVNVELIDGRSYRAWKYVNNEETKQLFIRYYSDRIDNLRKELAHCNKKLAQVEYFLCRTKLAFVCSAAFGSCLNMYKNFHDAGSGDMPGVTIRPLLLLFPSATGLIVFCNHFIDLILSKYKEESVSLQKKLDSFREARDKLENKLLHFQEGTSQGIRTNSIPTQLSDYDDVPGTLESPTSIKSFESSAKVCSEPV